MYLMQLPCGLDGRDHVVTSIDYGSRDVSDGVYVVEEEAVFFHPPAMDHVMADKEKQTKRMTRK